MAKLKYSPVTKDGKCIFCEFANRNIELKRIFWEDKNFIAFLSGWPTTEGYSVLIPKKHYASDIMAMPKRILKKYILAAKKVSNILINYYQDVGRVALIMEGMGVDHAHIKFFPMHGTGFLKTSGWRQTQGGKEEFFKKYPGYITSNSGPRVPEKKLNALAEKIKRSQR